MVVTFASKTVSQQSTRFQSRPEKLRTVHKSVQLGTPTFLRGGTALPHSNTPARQPNSPGFFVSGCWQRVTEPSAKRAFSEFRSPEPPNPTARTLFLKIPAISLRIPSESAALEQQCVAFGVDQNGRSVERQLASPKDSRQHEELIYPISN